MSAFVIWMDHREARVFKLKQGGADERHFKAHANKHPTAHHMPKPQEIDSHHPESESLYKDLAVHLHGASELLIVGPGDAKTRFKTHLEHNHKHDLATKIVAIETMDQATPGEIIAHARKFFKSHDLFT